MSDEDLTYYELDACKDPRLAGMQPGEERMFLPPPGQEPKPFESRFLELLLSDPRPNPVWGNVPESTFSFGHGKGVPGAGSTPVFTYPLARSAIDPPDVWRVFGCYLVSQQMTDLIERWDPGAIAYRRVDLRFADGLAPEAPYNLVDFVRVLDAVDFTRSVVLYKRWERELEELGLADRRKGKRNHFFERPFALKPDIASGVHVFRPAGRDEMMELDPLFSCEIVEQMRRDDFRNLRFQDPAIGRGQNDGHWIAINTVDH